MNWRQINWRKINWRKIAKNVFIGAAIGIGVVAVAAAIVSALGFGPGGIVAGSAAAGIMSSYGGFVSAGSLCAVFQSIGAIGVSLSVYVSTGAAAALCAFFVGESRASKA